MSITVLDQYMQGGYTQQHTGLAENNNGAGMGGPSTSGDKPNPDDTESPNTGADDDAQLNSDLVNIWTQRLQVLTVVTAFLASMDGQLFSLSAINTQIGLTVDTSSREIIYCCLAGALIFHICGGILAYVASFALVRYRIVEAVTGDGTKQYSRKIIAETLHPLQMVADIFQFSERFPSFHITRAPRLPPLVLLTRCFYTTLVLSGFGFLAALIGILAYVWEGLPIVVGISTTVCVGIGISAGVWALTM